MFRAAAPGPFDEAVNKATDENATSEDWAAILEVCDRVSSDATNGPKDAVQSLIKRLAHRNANVQLYTLELANALSQNCGVPLHRELSSRAFTDALLKLANDRNTHNLVRLKILERMKEWSEMFKSNTDLGIMQDAYTRLQQSQPQLQLAPPSAPQKNSLTEQDRQREEEDLQRALKLSLEDESDKRMAAPGGSSAGASAGPSGGAPAAQAGPSSAYGAPGGPPSETPTPAPQGTTAATVSRVRALFDFAASEPDELDFKKGDVIAVLESVYRDWWRGSLKGRTGIFPLNYVEILADPTPDELQREAMMESEVFAEIKNVEKLLTLLSASNTAPREEDTDEISKLYHQTLAIRPKLIKLIEKYSQKKDDFTQLNEKFIKARRDYEALLEASMSHPPQPNYQQYAMHPQQQQQQPPLQQQQQMPPQGYPGLGGPGGPPAQAQAQAHAGYPAPGLAQQQPDRYYTPGPQQRQDPYPHSPSPNQNRRNTMNPSPFYLANAEIPSPQQQQPPQHFQQAQQPQQHQQPQQQPTAFSLANSQPPQQHHQQHQQHQQQHPAALQHPGQRIPSGSGPSAVIRKPSPLQTNLPPQGAAVHGRLSPNPNVLNNQTYLPYNPHQTQTHTHAHNHSLSVSSPSAPGYSNHPQELSTSAYDSPIAQQHQPPYQQVPPQQQQPQPQQVQQPQQQPQQAPQQAPQPPVGSYAGGGYSPENEYASPVTTAAVPVSGAPAPYAGYPNVAPLSLASHAPSAPQAQAPPAPQQAPPPLPAAAAPPIPQSLPQSLPQTVSSPPPASFAGSPPPSSLTVGSPPLGSQQGGFYDARHTLPSRASGSGPSAPMTPPEPSAPLAPSAPTPVSAAGSPSPPAQFQQQQQYRPYVPPSDNNQQGTVDDYYRQTGQTGRVGY